MKSSTLRGFIAFLITVAIIASTVYFGFFLYNFISKHDQPAEPSAPSDSSDDSSDPIDKPDEPDEPTPIEPDEPTADVYAYTVDAEGVTITGRGTVTGSRLTIPSEIEGAAVVAIAANAFRGDTKINSVKIPAGVERIGESAFETCVCLSSIVIPSRVQTLGGNVFFGCSGLDDIYIEAHSAPECWASNWQFGCSAKVYWGGSWHYKDNGEAIGDDVIELPTIPLGCYVTKGVYDPNQNFVTLEDEKQ